MEMEKSRRKGPVRVRAAKKPLQPRAKPVSFSFAASEVKAVTVAGDFNNWDLKANPLKKGKRGVWKVMVRLQPGTYQYKFVVDGDQWKEDPLNPNKAPSPYGTFNSVQEVT